MSDVWITIVTIIVTLVVKIVLFICLGSLSQNRIQAVQINQSEVKWSTRLIIHFAIRQYKRHDTYGSPMPLYRVSQGSGISV